MAYVPGRGLDRSATQRLLERRRALDMRQARIELPPVDGSEQSALLLGNGAHKVPRCGKCTRPLDAAATEANKMVCARCNQEDAEKLEKRTRRTVENKTHAVDTHSQPYKRNKAVHFCSSDADEDVLVCAGALQAESNSEDAWLGIRARPAVLHGAYAVEMELLNDCLLRVGWAAPNSRRALGTDERSFGYGGTAMKSHANKFEAYGEPHEGLTGAVITCLLDRRDPKKQTISFRLNGRDLGEAFRIPCWMARVPLMPAVSGREDWHVAIRGTDFRYKVMRPFTPLGECMVPSDIDDMTTAGSYEVAREFFAPAPLESKREVETLDVPNENLIEIRSVGDEELDQEQILKWMEADMDLPPQSCHIILTESCHVGIIAFKDHRAAKSMLTAPPPSTSTLSRSSFSEEAIGLLVSVRPEERGATTDRVARRFIAGALSDDPGITADQLGQIRKPGGRAHGDETLRTKPVGKVAQRTHERSWRSRSRPERPGAAARLRPNWRDRKDLPADDDTLHVASRATNQCEAHLKSSVEAQIAVIGKSEKRSLMQQPSKQEPSPSRRRKKPRNALDFGR